jgi:hypothetical protein
MLKETVIIDLDVEDKDELSAQVRGTFHPQNEGVERFVDRVSFSYKQSGILTTGKASRASAAQQIFEYLRSFYAMTTSCKYRRYRVENEKPIPVYHAIVENEKTLWCREVKEVRRHG